MQKPIPLITEPAAHYLNGAVTILTELLMTIAMWRG
jgi:hypothetical protein